MSTPTQSGSDQTATRGPGILAALTKSLAWGLAYGIAASIVDFGFGAMMQIKLGMPPDPVFAARGAAAEMALGGVLGLAAFPVVLALQRTRPMLARLGHLAAMTAAWAAIARWMALDPRVLPSWLMAPVGGALLCLVGHGVSRWTRVLPFGVGIAAVTAAVVAPVVAYEPEFDASTNQRAAAVLRENLPNVVVVVLDTVRAANMSTYGYERETTPEFTKLAASSALFTRAVAPSTWSLPSHASLFTGWFPSAHATHGEHRMLGPEPPTMAQTLAEAGYETWSFTSNPHISDGFGLTRGLLHQQSAWDTGGGGRGFVFIYRLIDRLIAPATDKGGGAVVDLFDDFVDGWRDESAQRPFFAFLNFLEAHFPYHQLPERFLRQYTQAPEADLQEASRALLGAQFGRMLSGDEVARLRGPGLDMYDAGILYTDWLLGRVVEALGRNGLLDETVLVVLADHGELLGEDGMFGHGPSLAEPDLHVPLLVRYPPRIPRAAHVDRVVSTVGVFASVLDLADIPVPGPLHVGSLVPAIEGRPAGAPAIAERFVPERVGPAAGELPANPPLLARPDVRYRVYREDDWKLVETSDGRTALFDLATDPDEDHDLAGERPEELARLEEALQTWVEALGLPTLDAPVASVTGADAEEPAELDPAARERLKALGYIE
jgi:arylsulfatase A-like enzyme